HISCRLYGGDECADVANTYSNQRVLVYQLRRRQEGGGVVVHDPHVAFAQTRHRAVEGRQPLGVHFRQMIEDGHRRLGRGGQAGVGGPRPACRALGHHTHRPVGGGQVGGEDGDTVVGAAGGHHAVGAHHTDGGFDADESLEGGGHAAGTGGVGADRDIGLAQGDGHRRAGTRTTGDVFGSAGVADRAVGGAGADQAGQIGRAHV